MTGSSRCVSFYRGLFCGRSASAVYPSPVSRCVYGGLFPGRGCCSAVFPMCLQMTAPSPGKTVRPFSGKCSPGRWPAASSAPRTGSASVMGSCLPLCLYGVFHQSINARDRPHRSKSLKSLISPDKICIIVNLLLSSQTGSPCRKPVADVGGLQKGMLRDGPRRCPRLSSGCGNWERRPTSSPRPQALHRKRQPVCNHPVTPCPSIPGFPETSSPGTPSDIPLRRRGTL